MTTWWHWSIFCVTGPLWGNSNVEHRCFLRCKSNNGWTNSGSAGGLTSHRARVKSRWNMMTSSNENIFRVTGPPCGEFTGHCWIPLTKASDAELWCFIWSAPETNGWVSNRNAGDLRRHCTHYDVTVMMWCTQMTTLMGPTWGPPGSCRPQMGPMLAPWTLLSGYILGHGLDLISGSSQIKTFGKRTIMYDNHNLR